MSTATPSDRDRVLEALGRLAPWRADDRDQWLRVGMALHSELPDLYEDWRAWSATSKKYSERDCRTAWKSFHAGDGVTLGSLIAMAREDDPTYRPGGNGQSTSRPATRSKPAGPSSNGNGKTKPTHATFEAVIRAVEQQTGGTYVQHWPYPDGFFEVRVALPPGTKPNGRDKDYRPVHQTADGFCIGDPPGKLPMYGRDAIAQTPEIAVFEGPKCCDLFTAIVNNLEQPTGPVAITSAHGALSAKRTDWQPAAGKRWRVYRDMDADGEKYAQAVATIGASLHPPAIVEIVDLPGIPEGGDLAEWLELRDSQEPDTILAALQALPGRAAVTTGGNDGNDPTEYARPIITRLSDVAPQPIRWLWQPRIALGKLTLICGDPGLGKSFLTLDLAARVTTGAPWPDEVSSPFTGDTTGPRCRGSVVLMNAEDDLADTIRPRLDAAGADVSKVVALEGMQLHDNKSQRSVTLADLDAIETAIRGLSDCKVVIVDPVSAYLAGTDSHKNSDTRGLLAPLAAMAGKYGVAVLMVTHLSKTGGARAMYRAMGSLAFIAAARAAYLVAADKTEPGRRLWLPIKNNLGDDRNGLAYRLTGGAVAWESGTIDTTADEALEAEADRESGQGVKHEAAEWLREMLSAGPMEVTEINQQAKAAGFSGSLRRAREALPIKVYRLPGSTTSPWFWRLKKA